VISLEDALEVVRRVRRDDDVVLTTMASSKVWMDLGSQHPRDFVVVPSCMGHATSYGLGIALAQPQRRVIVCNGDGSMLMNLGSLVTIAAQRPRNLTVIVMDNGVYEVTGAQPVPARADFVGLARASGIVNAHRWSAIDAWRHHAADAVATAGPNVVVLDIEPVPGRPAPKSPGNAAARAIALRSALTGQLD
jgi:thiamine pyrophosphate-dependent acetolactate synthase large subunit-like protein